MFSLTGKSLYVAALDRAPILFAYSLGKAQEVMAILAKANVPVTTHGAVHAMARVYEEAGVRLGAYEKYDALAYDGTRALIWPPSGKTRPKAPTTPTSRSRSSRPSRSLTGA